MIQICNRIWVGGQDDYYSNIDSFRKDDWVVIQCAKDPFHREALGYKEKSAPKDNPEYYFCQRGNRLILNLIDGDDPFMVPPQIVHKAIGFASIAYKENKNVFFHCNHGISRSPVLAMLTLYSLKILQTDTFNELEIEFKKIYPPYCPAIGMRLFAKRYFNANFVAPESINKGKQE